MQRSEIIEAVREAKQFDKQRLTFPDPQQVGFPDPLSEVAEGVYVYSVEEVFIWLGNK